jgi:hypothetical protein
MPNLHNWYLHIDQNQLIINHAEPTNGNSSEISTKPTMVTKGHGSESGQRVKTHQNSYLVHKDPVSDAKIECGILKVCIGEVWFDAPWKSRFQNSNWARHTDIAEVERLIKSAKIRKII